ncbi:MAG TPA: hypothetical protein VM911_14705 [Pyrinomonadaceae bacterium]|nr:hypothetical protein [Pyrinomonadaceae bacterium]
MHKTRPLPQTVLTCNPRRRGHKRGASVALFKDNYSELKAAPKHVVYVPN